MRVEVVDQERTRELRRRVLRPTLPPDAPLPGDDLPDGVHVAAVDDDGTVLCTCFVYPDPCPWLPDLSPSWHLRQMATDEAHRNRGIGGAVVEAAVVHAAQQGARVVWCNARERAVPFYVRHGFVGRGNLFTDERHTIPHLRMARVLAGT